MSYNKKVPEQSWPKYQSQEAQKMIKERQVKRTPSNELREMIQNEVYEILGGIKTEIEGKMKQVDGNIAIIRSEIMQLKRMLVNKNGGIQILTSEVEGTLREVFSRIDKIQKEVLTLKGNQTINDSSNLHQSDFSKSNISLKSNQNHQKSTSKEKTISPLFMKTTNLNPGIDLGAIIFEDEKPLSTKGKTIQYAKTLEESPISKNQQKKPPIFSNPIQQQPLRKPPLPSTDFKPKFSTSYEMNSSSASSTFYDPPSSRPQNYQSQRNNQMIPSQTNPIQKVEKQLSKNKNVFMRKKKIEEKIDSPPKQPEKSFTSHKFENQLEDFSPTYEDESFNIQLEYSKDTFLSDL